MRYLLDTCVISELVNRRPNTRVVEWLSRQDPDSLYLSYITVGEIKKGIAKRGGDVRALRRGRFRMNRFDRQLAVSRWLLANKTKKEKTEMSKIIKNRRGGG